MLWPRSLGTPFFKTGAAGAARTFNLFGGIGQRFKKIKPDSDKCRCCRCSSLFKALLSQLSISGICHRAGPAEIHVLPRFI